MTEDRNKFTRKIETTHERKLTTEERLAIAIADSKDFQLLLLEQSELKDYVKARKEDFKHKLERHYENQKIVSSGVETVTEDLEGEYDIKEQKVVIYNKDNEYVSDRKLSKDELAEAMELHQQDLDAKRSQKAKQNLKSGMKLQLEIAN